MTPFSFASPISSWRKPASVVLCAMGGIRTIEDRTPRSARPITVVSTTLRTRRLPLYLSPPGRAGSSSVAGRPSFSHPGEPMLPDTTSGFPVPASASPYASMIWTSAAATAASPPEGSRSCLCATWMTPSVSAAAALSPSRSEISPRRTLAPSADTAAADSSDRAKLVTSWPAAIRLGIIYEPMWPVPPVTKTCMLLLLLSDVMREAMVGTGDHSWPALRQSGCVHLRGPGQCLRVDIFPDARQSAVPDGYGEYPVVLERLVRGLDLPRSEADDQYPVSLRYELPGFRRRFYRLGCRLKQIRQPGVSAARSSQRPVLARDDPLNIFGDQRQQALLVATTDRGEEVLHSLDVVLDAHSRFSISLGSCTGRSRVSCAGQ